MLRTYNQAEAGIDIYADETKNKYKGSIALDKASSPLLIVKNYDPKKKKAAKNAYFLLKVDGKRTFQFTTDSFRELKEWTALTRQAIDNGKVFLSIFEYSVFLSHYFCHYTVVDCIHFTGYLFSGRVTEPATIADGMVNVKFNVNCISILCPINEIPVKTWRLDQITSFGQCGGMLMFESCSICSDPGAARCSMNIIQEKPSTILNLMEKTIRNNPNTGEIHYERSILGDIYHCDHDCASRGMLAAFSEPNLFRSASSSPVKGVRLLPVDIHEFDQDSELEQSDSGFPGTPKHADDLSLASSIPSPVGSNRSNPSAICNVIADGYPSPTPSSHISVRSTSESVRQYSLSAAGESFIDYARGQSDGDSQRGAPKRLIYSTMSTSSSRHDSWDENAIQVTPLESPVHGNRYKKHSLSEEGIYDIPNCEPAYWEVGGSFTPSLDNPSVKRSSVASNRSQSAAVVHPMSSRKSSAQNCYTPGSDRRDREDDFEELPPIVPKHRKQRPYSKEMVKIESSRNSRPRLCSSGTVLDAPRRRRQGISENPGISRQMGSMDSLDQVGKSRSNSLFCTTSTDITKHLQEQEKILDRLLADTRKQRSDGEVFSKGFKPYQNPDLLDDPLYSTPNNDKVVTKVAADNVRGYAYKVQIPHADKITQYDVPRKRAPVPDLTNLRSDAPPKPKRDYNS